MNAHQSQLNNLHKQYIKCIDSEMSSYLAAPTEGVKEFCPQEKADYFTYMQRNFPAQFQNVLRVEANTF